MRAVRFHGVHDVRLDDVESQPLGPNDVRISPEAVGVCGTDVHIVEGNFMSRPPMALGHEIAGRITELGSDVTSVKMGELVTVEPHLYCGTCFNCQTGSFHMCPTRRAPGVHLDGGMAEELVVPETLAYRVPEGVEAWQAALTEPVACCIHGLDRLELRSGLPIAIFGAGPIGAILISLAKLAGMGPIVAIEPRPSRRILAQRFGADVVLDPGDADFVDQAKECTAGVGFPYVIDAVGHPAAISQGLGIVCRAGKLLLLGVAPKDARVEISPYEIYAAELSILGTALNPNTHRRAANLLPRLGLERLTVGRFPLQRFEEALEAQRTGAFDKVIIEPQAPAQG